MNGGLTHHQLTEWKEKAAAYDKLLSCGMIAFTEPELEAYVQVKVAAALKANAQPVGGPLEAKS